MCWEKGGEICQQRGTSSNQKGNFTQELCSHEKGCKPYHQGVFMGLWLEKDISYYPVTLQEASSLDSFLHLLPLPLSSFFLAYGQPQRLTFEFLHCIHSSSSAYLLPVQRTVVEQV